MWSWRGAVALTLAVAIGVGWVVAVVSLFHPGVELSRTATVLLYALGGTLLGGVVGYMAGKGDER